MVRCLRGRWFRYYYNSVLVLSKNKVVSCCVFTVSVLGDSIFDIFWICINEDVKLMCWRFLKEFDIRKFKHWHINNQNLEMWKHANVISYSILRDNYYIHSFIHLPPAPLTGHNCAGAISRFTSSSQSHMKDTPPFTPKAPYTFACFWRWEKPRVPGIKPWTFPQRGISADHWPTVSLWLYLTTV